MEQTDTHAGESACSTPISVQSAPTATPVPENTAKSLRMGILFCLIGTLLYSCSNICYKELAVQEVDMRWVLCMKELVCVVCVTPAILFWAVRRQYVWPSWQWIVFLLIGGFVCEFVGARLHLWAIGTIGLIVSLPLLQASNIVCSAGIGHSFLGERVSGRCKLAMGVMLAAICCLFFGPAPSDAEQSSQQIAGNTLLLGGIGAIVAGVAYSVYIVFLRRSSNSRQVPISFIAVEITGIGVVIFGFEFIRDHSYQISALWSDIPAQVWWLVIVAGLFNMIGFLFQITGIRYTLVARAQMISVAQIVVGTLFGVFFYNESTNAMIWLGVSLTVLGIVIVSTPGKKELVQDANG